MAAQTPYDDDRRLYSRSALARLVLAHQARGISDAAGSLVVTRYDPYCGAGGRVSEASTLAAHADRLVASAVIYERERGSSWEDVGRYLGIDGKTAKQRFAPAVAEWHAAFEVPYRLDETGRKRIPQLPAAAYDPKRVIRDLDLWAHVRVMLKDKHAVSGGVDPRVDEETIFEPDRTEIEGSIKQQYLTAFLELLSHYVHHSPDDGVWDQLVEALEDPEPEDSDAWHTYAMTGIFESLDIRMARVDSSDLVSVVAINAHSANLRLRISTLMDIFERL